MPAKPKYASEYTSRQVELVRATCLYIATKLGDMMDELVIIGGFVPSLLIDQTGLNEVDTHPGTMDLDVGLTLALLDEGRYKTLTERLRAAGFAMSQNEEGNPTRQQWIHPEAGGIQVDFLIEPSMPGDRGGKLRNIEADFAAIIAPGLGLAFQNHKRVTLEGRTIFGEKATRDFWVCGAGAFVVLKALAFDSRGENKDAFDLYYVLRNYGTGTAEIAAHLEPHIDVTDVQKALRILARDFSDAESVGPRRAAEFRTGGPDEEMQADVVGFVSRFVADCERLKTTR